MTTQFQNLQVGDIFCVTTTEKDGEEIRQHSKTYCVQTLLPQGCIALGYDHTLNIYTLEIFDYKDLGDVTLCAEDGNLFADLVVDNGHIIKVAR